MKAFKKVFASVMVTAMLATMGVSAMADNAQKRSRQCDDCGIGTVTATVYRSPWQYVGTVGCTHEGGVGQLDERYTRVVTTVYSCTNCNYNDSRDRVEEKYVHLGK